MKYLVGKLLLGTVLSAVMLAGESQALGKAQANTKAEETTFIFPLTKKIVATINQSKSSTEAWDKLCGKKGLKGGLMRDGAAMKTAASYPHFAALVAYACHDYKGFDGSDMSKIAKKVVWGAGNEKKSFKVLMNQPIKPIEIQFVAGAKKGEQQYKAVHSKNGGNDGRTLTEEVEHYIDLPGPMNNSQYLVCKVEDKKKLPKNLNTLYHAATCSDPAVPAVPAPKKTIVKKPDLPPVEHVNHTRGALVDLDDGRGSINDGPKSFNSFGSINLDDHASEKPKLSGAGKHKPVRKNSMLKQEASLGEVEKDPSAHLSKLDVNIPLHSKKHEEAAKPAARQWPPKPKVRGAVEQQHAAVAQAKAEKVAPKKEKSAEQLGLEAAQAKYNAAQKLYNEKKTFANKKSLDHANVDLGKAQRALSAAPAA